MNFKQRQIRAEGTLTHLTRTDDKVTLCGRVLPQPVAEGLLMVHHPCEDCHRIGLEIEAAVRDVLAPVACASAKGHLPCPYSIYYSPTQAFGGDFWRVERDGKACSIHQILVTEKRQR